MSFSRRLSGLLAGFALIISGLVLTSAPVQAAPADGCAKQEQQLAKAEAALERVTAVFAKKKAKVKNARAEVRGSETRSEKAQAKRDLKKAKAKKVKAKKAKKAQLKRVEKKQARLDACESEPEPEA